MAYFLRKRNFLSLIFYKKRTRFLSFFGHVIGTFIGTLLELPKSSKRNRRFQAKKAPKSLQISDSGLIGRGNKT